MVTLEGNRPDIELLLGESAERLSASDDPRRARLEFEDHDHELATDEARQAGKAAIDAAVRHVNGFGRLRWGRTYGGVEVKDVLCIDSSGRAQHVVFLEPAYDHMLPEDFADMVERFGHRRPELPDGIHDVNALDLGKITALADENPDVARVLRLVELMLDGDDDIATGRRDTRRWRSSSRTPNVAVRAAKRLAGGRRTSADASCRWRTASKPSAYAHVTRVVSTIRRRKRLTPKETGWFVRRVAARWLARLLLEAEVSKP